MKTWLIAIALGLAVGLPAQPARVRAQDFVTRATFDLVVREGAGLRSGTSRIVTQSAVATRVHELLPGNADGLELQFFTMPLTPAAIADIRQTGGRGLQKTEYAALVLFLDARNRVAQANLSVVVPGSTVARTIAWKPEDLEKYFSKYQFDGQRLLLKSTGTYNETESGKEALRLSWDVDCDLQVVERR